VLPSRGSYRTANIELKKKMANDLRRQLMEMEREIEENHVDIEGRTHSESESELDMTKTSTTCITANDIPFTSFGDTVLPLHISSTQNDDLDNESNLKGKKVYVFLSG
jgi:hypothetical protein